MPWRILKHRGSADPTKVFPTLLPRELSVNTSNRQIALGHETTGAPLDLIAIRYFDARAQYAADELVVQAGKIYRAKATVPPGTFNAANWDEVKPPTTGRQAMLPGVYVNFDHARDAMLASGISVSR